MRIESIYIENFQGLRHANLTLSAPITMVCDLNGAGNSSLKEAAVWPWAKLYASL